MKYVTKFSKDCNQGPIDRRRLLQALGLSATSAFAVGVLPRGTALLAASAVQGSGAGKVFPVTTVNHLSYPSLDYKKVRDFYVDLLGMRAVWDDGTRCQVDCGPTDAPNSLYITQAQPGVKPNVAHFAFGLPNFWALRQELRDDMVRRGLKGVREDGEAGWFVEGPSGYVSQPVTVKDSAMFPGAASPCIEAKSAKCKQAYEAGLKNLGSIPKAGGQGFKAVSFKYIVLRVPDVGKERDYFTSLFGMKVVSDKPNDCSLRFGDNTLVLRQAGPDGKPTCHEFGFVVESYDQAKVKAELDRRGISSKPNGFGGLALNDPNGLEIGIAGRG